MRVLVSTHAQMFRTPDGIIWTKSVYSYSFFKRYLNSFEDVRVLARVKEITYDEISAKLQVTGPNLEIYALPFYRGPQEYAKNFMKIKKKYLGALANCDAAILRVPDQISFQLFRKLKKKGIPIAVEVVAHPWDLYAPGNINFALRPIIRVMWDYSLKKICSESDGVAYVTERYIQNRYPSNIDKEFDNRFEAIYTSADLASKFYYRPRKKTEFSDNTISLVHVSNINDNAKGHDIILETLKNFELNKVSVKCTFIGGGILLKKFENKAQELGLSNVFFTGNISDYDEIINILIKSDIFVFPSSSEGLPRVLLEAMASGLPCITSDVGGIPEVISDRAQIKSNNAMELEKKIIEFISSKELLASESKKNFEMALNFSDNIVTIKREAFYNKLRMLATEV